MFLVEINENKQRKNSKDFKINNCQNNKPQENKEISVCTNNNEKETLNNQESITEKQNENTLNNSQPASPENDILSLSQPNIEPNFREFNPMVFNRSPNMTGNLEEDENNNNSFDSNLLDINNKIVSLIYNERKKIQNKKDEFEKLKSDFALYKKAEIINLNEEKEKLKHLFLLKNGVSENDILELNIGGTHEITTLRNTLIKYKNSALAALFCGDSLQEIDGKIFIDRDGDTFLNMIKFLRNGTLPYFEDEIERHNFFNELKFWRINYDRNLLDKKNN